jgi:hypothetical protein
MIRIENPSTVSYPVGGKFFPYIPGTNTTAKFVDNGNTLELWWNGTLVQSWTVTPVTPDLTGQPI